MRKGYISKCVEASDKRLGDVKPYVHWTLSRPCTQTSSTRGGFHWHRIYFHLRPEDRSCRRVRCTGTDKAINTKGKDTFMCELLLLYVPAPLYGRNGKNFDNHPYVNPTSLNEYDYFSIISEKQWVFTTGKHGHTDAPTTSRLGLRPRSHSPPHATSDSSVTSYPCQTPLSPTIYPSFLQDSMAVQRTYACEEYRK